MNKRTIDLYTALIMGKLACHGDTPSYDWLEERSGVNRSEIRGRLHKLEEEGLLVVESGPAESLRVKLVGEEYKISLPDQAHSLLYPEEPLPKKYSIKGWDADVVVTDESHAFPLFSHEEA